MKIKPLGDMVLVQADKEQAQTESGFFVVHEWKKLPHTGKVLAVGPDCNIKVGEAVHFNRYAFMPIGDDRFIGSEKNLNFTYETS